MTLIETVTLSGPAARVWELLVTEGGALRLAPGLAVGADGRGTLRIVLDGHSLTYRGYARQHVEEAGKHLTWTLSGKEVRGPGRAHAEIRARFRDSAEGTTSLRLTVLVEGRGRLADIAPDELDRVVHSALGRFRRAIAKELEAAAPASPAAQSPPRPDWAPEPAVSAARPAARVEIVPPTRSSRRRVLPAGVALGSLAAGFLALLVWRSRRRR